MHDNNQEIVSRSYPTSVVARSLATNKYYVHAYPSLLISLGGNTPEHAWYLAVKQLEKWTLEKLEK